MSEQGDQDYLVMVQKCETMLSRKQEFQGKLRAKTGAPIKDDDPLFAAVAVEQPAIYENKDNTEMLYVIAN